MILDDSGFGGRWSPDGSRILFVGRTAEDHHKAIWIVDADGADPEQLPITPACGGPNADPHAYGCYSPSWSPRRRANCPDPIRPVDREHVVLTAGDLDEATPVGVDDVDPPTRRPSQRPPSSAKEVQEVAEVGFFEEDRMGSGHGRFEVLKEYVVAQVRVALCVDDEAVPRA